MKVLSIDIGLVSLGWSTWDSLKGNVRFGICNVRDAVPKKSRKDYCLIAKTFIDERPDLFKDTQVVLLERQMQAGMKQFTTALRAFLWHRTKVYLVSPIVVKRYFGSSPGNYKANKQASVALFVKMASTASNRLFAQLKKKQQTDVADAHLQMFWYLYKNKLDKVAGESITTCG